MSSRSHERAGFPIVPVTCLAIAALAVAAYEKGCGEGTPVHITPDSAVQDIEIATEAPLINVIGKSSVRAYQETHVWNWVPGIGGKKVPLTGRDVEATDSGAVELRAERNAITLQAYKLPKTTPNAPDKWGIRAKIDADKIELRASVSTLFVNGEPQVSPHQEAFALQNATGVARRTAKAEAGAQVHFTTSCGAEALSTLPAGAKRYIRDVVTTTAGAVKDLPGGIKEAALLREMVRDPRTIDVVFTQHAELPSGHLIASPVDASNINVRVYDTFTNPPRVVPFDREKDAMQQLIGKGSDIKLDAGDPCTFSGPAAKKLNEFSNLDNPAEV